MIARFGELLIVAAVPVTFLISSVRWVFFPSGRVPRWRVRHLRLRLRLRLYPGRGHATVAELRRYWSRRAAYRVSARSRPSQARRQRARNPDEHSIALGTAHCRRRLRGPMDEHVVIVSPPRAGGGDLPAPQPVRQRQHPAPGGREGAGLAHPPLRVGIRRDPDRGVQLGLADVDAADPVPVQRLVGDLFHRPLTSSSFPGRPALEGASLRGGTARGAGGCAETDPRARGNSQRPLGIRLPASG